MMGDATVYGYIGVYVGYDTSCMRASHNILPTRDHPRTPTTVNIMVNTLLPSSSSLLCCRAAAMSSECGKQKQWQTWRP